jgi:hypothetical protein
MIGGYLEKIDHPTVQKDPGTKRLAKTQTDS